MKSSGSVRAQSNWTMASDGLPPISSVPTRTFPERLAILDLLFEPCRQLHTLSVGLLSTEKFSSYDEMIASVGIQLTDLAESQSTSDIEWLHEILAAHPRLGEKKVNSAQSRIEQAQLNSGGSTEEPELMKLNSEYERAFPGLRYVYVV